MTTPEGTLSLHQQSAVNQNMTKKQVEWSNYLIRNQWTNNVIWSTKMTPGHIPRKTGPQWELWTKNRSTSPSLACCALKTYTFLLLKQRGCNYCDPFTGLLRWGTFQLSVVLLITLSRADPKRQHPSKDKQIRGSLNVSSALNYFSDVSVSMVYPQLAQTPGVRTWV